MLTKDSIFAADDIKSEVVSVPEWGGSLTVRGLTGSQRDAFEQSLIDAKKKGASVDMRNMRAKLVVRSVVDESGALLFSDSDAEALGNKSAAPLDRLFSAAQKLSGMTDADLEEMEKNLLSIPAEGSPSA